MGLSKEAFVDRVTGTAKGWGETLTKARLDEWMKQRLIEAARRQDNHGLRPSYVYDRRHYRRALQLLRLRAAGIVERDAIILQLFCRGYGVSPKDVRSALSNEVSRARSQLHSSVRSTYADRGGNIPAKRWDSLLRQIGEQDQRFAAAGFAISPGLIIDIMRASRSAEISSDTIRELTARYGVDEQFARLAIDVMSYFGPDPSSRNELDLHITKVTDEQLRDAQLLFICFRQSLRAQIARETRHAAEAWQLAHDALGLRGFVALLLLGAVVFIRQNRLPASGAT